MTAESKRATAPLVLVASTRGNAGVSTVATAVAAELAARFGKQKRGCLLVDACPKGGVLAANLGLRAYPNLVGLLSGVNSSTIRQRTQRIELWRSHAQRSRRKNLWVVTSPGDPLSAWWTATTISEQVSEYFWSVVGDGVPIVGDIGQLSAHDNLGWELLRNSTLTVLIVGAEQAATADLDLIYAVCASTARTVILVPARKQVKDQTVDFWSQTLLGGWGRYRDRLQAREQVSADLRISDHLYTQSEALGVRKINEAQRRLLDARSVNEQTSVPSPIDVAWLPYHPAGAEQCQRGILPLGALGKTVHTVCDLSHRSRGRIVRKASHRRKLLARGGGRK